MGAVSDVDAAHKSAKNPSLFRKVFSGQSIEQEAIEAFAAKKKLEAQRDELKNFIMFTHGTRAWDELLAMEGDIRKRRQKEIYEAKERREKKLSCGALVYLPLALVLLFFLPLLMDLSCLTDVSSEVF